jgi:hypothetical protein
VVPIKVDAYDAACRPREEPKASTPRFRVGDDSGAPEVGSEAAPRTADDGYADGAQDEQDDEDDEEQFHARSLPRRFGPETV